MGLRAKHLPDELINDAIAAIDTDTYNANIRKLILSKRNQDRQKQLRFMLQRGYTYDDLSSLNTQH
jgi:SOS response regulatory protein OraA/RecX